MRAVFSIGLATMFLNSGAAEVSGLPDFTKLVNANRAAVVNIGTTGTRRTEADAPRGGIDPLR